MHSESVEWRRLRQDIRGLKVAVAGLAGLAAILLLGAAARQTTFAELNAERINIVDANGKPRLVIANAERFPPVLLNGRTYQRSVAPAGLVFFDTSGNEVGGLAVTDLDPGRVLALAFDYPNFDAIGMQTRISPDGKDATAGLIINSRPPADLEAPAAARAAATRVAVENHNETAQLVLSDPQGRPRLQLRVDPSGVPSIEMLDETGKPTYRVAQHSVSTTEREIRDLEMKDADAVLRSDFAAMEKTWAEDFTVNSPNNRITKGRDNVLKLIRAGNIGTYALFVREIESVTRYENVAIVMGMETVKRTSTAAPTRDTVRRRYMNVWTKRGEQWLLTARQANVVSER